jgi:hypothetical protein
MNFRRIPNRFVQTFFNNLLGGHLTAQASEVIGWTCGILEIARRVLAVAALLWCIWSWRKEWWVPAGVATLFTALVLFEAFFIDT